MKAVYWVIPDLLAGRPGPQEMPWDLEELQSGGLRAILSLSADVDEEAIAATGFHHGRYYFPPIPLLTRFEKRAFLNLMDEAIEFIQAQLAEGCPTLVHCHAGKDRTGAVLAGYLMRYQGLSSDEAIHLVRQANPRAMTAPGYEGMPELLENTIR